MPEACARGDQVALALQTVRFGEMLEDMLDDLLPNRITEYVYELSNLFSAFYTECKARCTQSLNVLQDTGHPIALCGCLAVLRAFLLFRKRPPCAGLTDGV